MIQIIDLALENVLKLYLRKIRNYAYNFNIKKYHWASSVGPIYVESDPRLPGRLGGPLGHIYRGSNPGCPRPPETQHEIVHIWDCHVTCLLAPSVPSQPAYTFEITDPLIKKQAPRFYFKSHLKFQSLSSLYPDCQLITHKRKPGWSLLSNQDKWKHFTSYLWSSVRPPLTDLLTWGKG